MHKRNNIVVGESLCPDLATELSNLRLAKKHP